MIAPPSISSAFPEVYNSGFVILRGDRPEVGRKARDVEEHTL